MERFRNLQINDKINHHPSIKAILQFIRPLRKFWIELCDNSSIHGLRYFTERLLHWSERLFWVIAICVSLWLCGSLVKGVWVGWQENPVTMSFTEKPVHIFSIPFPTITLCPEIKTLKQKFDLSAALSHLSNLSKIEVNRLNALAHICPLVPKLKQFEDNFTNESIYETIIDLALQFIDIRHGRYSIIPRYSGTGKEYLAPVLTDEGLCFTINALNSHDIYTDAMAPEMMTVKINPNVSDWHLRIDNITMESNTLGGMSSKYPIQMHVAGRDSLIVMHLQIMRSNWEYQCRENHQGFKVILTTPGDVPKMSKNAIRVPLLKRNFIGVKAKLTTTSEGLRNYDPNQRQCFFEFERQLHFFKVYSQGNCEQECLANFTKSECGCVKFSMPRERTMKICGVARISCYNAAEKKLSVGTDKDAKSFHDKCNCLPTCTSIEYNAIVDREDFDIRHLVSSTSFKAMSSDHAMLQVFFEDIDVETVKRVEVNTVSDFLAICGSFLGLFLGISVLSIIELVYYSSLRLFWFVRWSRLRSTEPTEPVEQTPTNNKFIRVIRVFSTDLCKNSNIHGLRYFTERTLHWGERLWWMVCVGVSLWLCGSMISKIWQQWQENPVTIIFTEDATPISAIPFPTITICSQTKVLKQKFNVDIGSLVKHSELSEILTKRLSVLVSTCKLGIALYDHKKKYPLYMNETYDIIQDIAPKFDDVMHACWWRGQRENCSKYFAPVLTDDGLCFIFNALNSYEIYTDKMATEMMIVKSNPNVSSWSLESGYETEPNTNEYPMRLIDSKDTLIVDLVLNRQDFVGWCNANEQGFYAKLTLPGDTVKMSEKPFRVSISEDTRITINPKLITTSEGLRSYNPNERGCFFNFERRLRFFKIYTQKNCEAECVANWVKDVCGCVKFSMPRNKSTQVCGLAKFRCYKYIEVISQAKKFLLFDKCNCLPTCTSIEYNADIDQVNFDMDTIKRIGRLYTNTSSDFRLARLSIFFRNQQFETEQRVESLTFPDFLALCGGLLGLFMGVSALSVVELIYFFTLRLFWTIYGLRAQRP